MSSSNLIRLGALAAVTAGALLLIGELLYLVVGLSPDVENLATTSSGVAEEDANDSHAGQLLERARERAPVRGPRNEVARFAYRVAATFVVKVRLSSPSAWSTTMVSPGLNSPPMMRLESGFSM